MPHDECRASCAITIIASRGARIDIDDIDIVRSDVAPQNATERFDLARYAVQADTRGCPAHRRNGRAVDEDVDLLAVEQPSIDIVNVTGDAGKSLDEGLLHGRELILAAEIFGDAAGDLVEMPASSGSAVDCATRKCGDAMLDRSGFTRRPLANRTPRFPVCRAPPAKLVAAVSGAIFLDSEAGTGLFEGVGTGVHSCGSY
jgi:hypothetical protein